LQDKSDAEDVTAKTFFALWENRYSLESPKHVVGYLFMVARNAATDILRKRARSMAAQKKLVSIQKEASEDSDLEMIEAEVLSRLFAEVQKMPERMRDIFILTYLKKLPAAKVSELMGVQSVTVYTVCQRAMQRLKLAMLEHGPESVTASIILSLSIVCL
jgi:RNA polymerase sigma factor (sigma-70 family)